MTLNYQTFSQTMTAELHPGTLLESCLTDEIAGAAWRLRQCNEAESKSSDFTDAIDRSRTQNTRLLHRNLNLLRKLQTERRNLQSEDQLPDSAPPAVASFCKPPTPPREPERNKPCPCGSGAKYKFCCLRKGPGWELITQKQAA